MVVTRGRRLAAWLLLLAALVLAVLGQRYFFFRRDYVWDGVFMHGAALACFALSWRLAQPQPQGARPRRGLRRAWARGRPAVAALLVLGLFLTVVATLSLRGRGLQEPTGDAVTLWLLGMVAVVAAAFWPQGRRGGFGRGKATEVVTTNESGFLRGEATEVATTNGTEVRSNGFSREEAAEVAKKGWADWGLIPRQVWLELATVAGLTAMALILRVAALDQVPFTLGGDEAWHGLLARQVLRGELRNPFQMSYMSMPTAFYWPLSWSLWLAGNNLFGLRLLAALAGAASVPLFYLLVRGRWGRRTALLTALFLAAYDYHLHYSRLGANNVWDPLFVIVTLWAVDRGLGGGKEGERPGDRSRFFLLAGLVMGLSTYFYTGARLLPPLVLAYVAFVAWRERGRHRGLGAHLVLLALAFLVAAGPMLDFARTHPDEWNARINQVGIVQSGWLAREPGLTGKTTSRILAEQFLRSAGAFHVFPDRTVWYGADRPLLGFLAGIFALLGMGWAVVHWRQRRYFLLLLWFWSVIITGGILTESPPSSQRLVMAIPAVALLVAIGLEQSVGLGRRILTLDRRWEEGLLGLLVLILAASSVHFYFAEYTPQRRYGGENGETATMMGRYLGDLEGDYTAYLLGAPRLYWSFGTMTFLAPDVPGRDVIEPLTAPPDFVDPSRGAVFLLLPERASELAWIEQAYPAGKASEFHDSGGALRFVAYEVLP
jgi:4-amino-4-deoxy-L-arabinose transferase-like glycosyltransferase